MTTEKQPPLELVEKDSQQQATAVIDNKALPALAANSPAALMMQALGQGVSMEKISEMMDLQDRWEKKEAEKAFNAAFAAFKSTAIRVVRGRRVTAGPLQGRSYAELHDVVDAVTPALSEHGLSASWRLTRDEKDWIEVTCTLKHAAGHSESVSMGGPPDTGGAKNVLQARASTKSYLERYTLKAICGVAEGGDDDDGDGGAPQQQQRRRAPEPTRLDPSADIAEARKTKTDAEALAFWKKRNQAYASDLGALEEFKEAVAQHRLHLKNKVETAGKDVTDVEAKEQK